MSKANLILQNKGGVGKSYVSSIIASYLHDKNKADQDCNRPLVCYDTDPSNPTFGRMKALGVEHINIIKNDAIDARLFDEMIKKIMIAHEENNNTDFVIDVGSSDYVPLVEYMASSQIFSVLADMGIKLQLHPIVIRSALQDTLSGFAHLCELFKDVAKVFVWLNPYAGNIEHNGMIFEDMPVYKNHADAVANIIAMPDFNKQTFGADVSQMLEMGKPLFELVNDPEIIIPVRSRINVIKKEFYKLLDSTEIR